MEHLDKIVKFMYLFILFYFFTKHQLLTRKNTTESCFEFLLSATGYLELKGEH